MTTSLLSRDQLEELDSIVQRLKLMIPFPALQPVDEAAILRSKFAPKRSKIVSGKVIAAVAQSKAKAKAEAESSQTESVTVVEPPKIETAKPIDYSVDVKTRFEQRKGELQEQRHADSEENILRAKKRREKEEKKKKRNKKDKRPIEATSKDLETTHENKKIKSSDGSGLVVEEGAFTFSRLDKTDVSKTGPAPKKTTNDPKQALKKLEAEKAKIQQLKESDPEKAAALEAKLQAKKAIQKAQGIAVKDDEKKLKKAIARREKEKEKSRQLWEKKKAEVKETQEKRQAKRQENVQARIEAIKAKKRGLKVEKPKKSTHKSSSFKGKKPRK